MRKLLFVACLLFVLPVSVRSQETPKAELFGAYSYLHADGAGNLNGWNGSLSANVNGWFGLVADFSGHYGSESRRVVIRLPELPPITSVFESDTNVHTFMFGPRFSYQRDSRVQPFAHVLFGGARRHAKVSATISGTFGPPGPIAPPFSYSQSSTETGFAMALGGGVDWKLSKGIALRVIQADYLPTWFGPFTAHNARVSAGLVFRFGEK